MTEYPLSIEMPKHILEPTLIKPRVYKWEFRYFKEDHVVYPKEKAPNIFWRIMQKWIFGFHYERIDKE